MKIFQSLRSHTYFYIDKDNTIQELTLGRIRNFFRYMFGWSPETHLKNFIKKAFPITLSTGFQGTAQQRQKILQLFKKEAGKEETPLVQIASCTLLSGKTITVYGQYLISKNESDNMLKINKVAFSVTITDPSKDAKPLNIKRKFIFTKTSTGYLTEYKDLNPIRVSSLEDEDSLTKKLETETVQVICVLMAKILSQSKIGKTSCKVEPFAHNFVFLPNTPNKVTEITKPENSDIEYTRKKSAALYESTEVGNLANLDLLQTEKMAKLGWQYKSVDRNSVLWKRGALPSGESGEKPAQRLYTFELSKESALQTVKEFGFLKIELPPISLDFAFGF